MVADVILARILGEQLVVVGIDDSNILSSHIFVMNFVFHDPLSYQLEAVDLEEEVAAVWDNDSLPPEH